MIPDVIGFEILSDYKIRVTLSNGKEGVFDVTPYLDRGTFKELKDYSYFRRARIEFGTIAWPNEQDLSPETLECKMEKAWGTIGILKRIVGLATRKYWEIVIARAKPEAISN